MSQQTELSRAEQIRRSMAYLRDELDEDVGEVENSARTLLDWHYYTTHYPWACVGVAAALGYLVVPKKLEIHRPDPKTLEKLARKNHLVVDHKPKAEAKSGLLGSAFSFVSGLVLKTAMAQLGHQLAGIMDNKSNGADRPEGSQKPSRNPQTATRPRS